MSRTIRVSKTMRGMRKLARFISQFETTRGYTPVEVALEFDRFGRKPGRLVIVVPTMRRRT